MDHFGEVENYWAERYLLGELPVADLHEFEAHFFDCPECAEGVRALACFMANAKAALAAPRRNPWRERRMAWLRPAFAAPFGVVTALWVFTTYQYLNLRQSYHGQAVTSYVILPQARSEDGFTIDPRTAGRLMTLELLDLPEGSSPYAWELRLAGSEHVVASGVLRPLSQGATAQLLLESSRLKPGRYEVVLRGQQRQYVYPFAIRLE